MASIRPGKAMGMKLYIGSPIQIAESKASGLSSTALTGELAGSKIRKRTARIETGILTWDVYVSSNVLSGCSTMPARISLI